MRDLRTALGAGLAAAALVGFAGLAEAQAPQTHVLTIRLPGGAIEQIRYAGAAAPQIAIDTAPAATAFVPMSAPFAADPTFAELDRISAAMDRQAAQLFQEAAALSAQPARIDPTAIAALPAGSREYQFVSTMSGNGVCSHSVEITSQGNGAAPRVVTHSTGDCAAVPGLQVPTGRAPAAVPSSGPRMIMTKTTGPQPYARRIEEAALP